MTRLTESDLKRWMADLGPRLIALATRICRDRHQAEEIVQEAFVKLWRKPPDGGERAIPSWMRTVVTNASINALQRTKRPAALPEFSSDNAMQHDDTAGQSMQSAEDRTQLDAALARLDPAKRTILLLRGAEGLSYDEIANHLGVPTGTVMSRLNRARAALSEVLETMAEDSRDNRVFSFERYREA